MNPKDLRPWLGLASFTEAEATRFFGREEELAELLRRVQRKRLTVLFGQSGLGKTSLLQAGLATRALSAGLLSVRVRMDYAPDAPNAAEQVKRAIVTTTQGQARWTQTGVAVAGETLWEFLHHRDDQLLDDRGQQLRPLLVFDQFEEVFTLAQADADRRSRAERFIAELADLVENRVPAGLEARLEADDTAADAFDFGRDDYRVLISLREDYLAPLESLKARMPSVTQNRLRLEPLHGAHALQAARGPAPELLDAPTAEAVLRFVAGAGPERPLAELSAEPSLLSLFLYELNEQRIARGEARIDSDLLAGSQASILSDFYERSLADQPADVRRFVEDRLLTDSGYRDNVSEERTRQALAAAGAAPHTLEALVDRRLLRMEERGDQRRVELTHDVLCPVVRASRDSRQAREAQEAAQARLAAEARAQSERLATARASVRRSRRIALGAGLLALVAVGSGVYGWWSGQRAQQAESRTETLRAQADTARREAETLLAYLSEDFFGELSTVGQVDLMQGFVDRLLRYYDKLPAELRGPASIRSHAAALLAQSELAGARGDSAARLQAAQAALKLLMPLDGVASDLATQWALARAERLVSRAAWAASEVGLARTSAQEAVDRLVKLDASVPEAQRLSQQLALGQAYAVRAYVDMREGDSTAAVKLYGAAVAQLRAAGGGDGGNHLAASRFFAATSGLMTEAASTDGQTALAIQIGREGLRRTRWWLTQQPGNLDARRKLVNLAAELGNALVDASQFTEGIALLREAVKVGEGIVAQDPGDKASYNLVAFPMRYLAGALLDAGHPREALRINEAAMPFQLRSGNSRIALGNAMLVARLSLGIAAEIEPPERLPAYAAALERSVATFFGARTDDETLCQKGYASLVVAAVREPSPGVIARADENLRQCNGAGPSSRAESGKLRTAAVRARVQAILRDWQGLLRDIDALQSLQRKQASDYWVTLQAFKVLALHKLGRGADAARALDDLDRRKAELPSAAEVPQPSWYAARHKLLVALVRAGGRTQARAEIDKALAQLPAEMREMRSVREWAAWAYEGL